MRIAVYGLGNVLRRDDGFGPSAVRRLESDYEFPSDVELRDLGTPGLDLASHLTGRDVVVFLDSAAADGPPGTLRVFSREEIVAGAARAPRVTGHEADLSAALQLAELVGDAPRHVCLIGVVPQDLGSGAGLSAAVLAALGPACDRALSEIARFDVVARRRAESLATGAWWESASV